MIGYIPIWGNPAVHFEQIKARRDASRIVILGETEFHLDSLVGDNQLLVDICAYAASKKIPVYFITGLSHKNGNLIPETHILYNKFNILYWPTFWFSYSLVLLNRELTYNANLSRGINVDLITPYKDHQHTFISMNNMPHTHRVAMMDMFAKYDLIKDNKISFRELKQARFYYWENPQPLFLDQAGATGKNFDRETLPDCYNDCFMQVSGESDATKLYTISGSTVVPLLFNKPFLTFGAQYFMRHLESFGFLRYDEIFDYSFDSVWNYEERAEVLAIEVSRIQSLKHQWKEMYYKIYPKLVHNRKLALKYAFDISQFPPIYMELSHQEFISSPENPYPYFHHPINFIGHLNNIRDKFQSQL